MYFCHMIIVTGAAGFIGMHVFVSEIPMMVMMCLALITLMIIMIKTLSLPVFVKLSKYKNFIF